MTKTKIKQNLMSWIAAISMLLIFGTIGGMDFDRISMAGGLIRITIYFAIFILSASKIELGD